jgi:DNA-binding XRE family transcriptional regulator
VKRREVRHWDDAFASALRDARKRCGVSQEQVGRWLGFHQTAITKVELRSRTVSVGEAVDIAALFGLSLDDFLAMRFDGIVWVGCDVCRGGVPDGFRCATCGAL